MKIALRHGPFRHYPEERPKTRAGCEAMARPCPFATCKWHLLHQIHRNLQGEMVMEVVHEDPLAMRHTCALDGREWTTSDIAEACGVTRQRVDQIVESVARRLRATDDFSEDMIPDERVSTWWEVSDDQDEERECRSHEEGDSYFVTFDWDFGTGDE